MHMIGTGSRENNFFPMACFLCAIHHSGRFIHCSLGDDPSRTERMHDSISQSPKRGLGERQPLIGGYESYGISICLDDGSSLITYIHWGCLVPYHLYPLGLPHDFPSMLLYPVLPNTRRVGWLHKLNFSSFDKIYQLLGLIKIIWCYKCLCIFD